MVLFNSVIFAYICNHFHLAVIMYLFELFLQDDIFCSPVWCLFGATFCGIFTSIEFPLTLSLILFVFLLSNPSSHVFILASFLSGASLPFMHHELLLLSLSLTFEVFCLVTDRIVMNIISVKHSEFFKT